MVLGVYRTKTYLAGDWTGDSPAIRQIIKWNESSHWSLHYRDVHELTQCRDSTFNCNIKRSLKARMDISKTFVMVVGEHTKFLRSGSCNLCERSQKDYWGGSYCEASYSYDSRSYINYECDIAVAAGIKIVVLYNSSVVEKNKCPLALRNIGTHKEMMTYNYMRHCWEYDYNKVKKAIEE